MVFFFFLVLECLALFFFFSSRRRHTRCSRDWSSDVCSSDLADTLARHGGDEFVVVISEVNAEADCQIVADKILRALAAEFRVDGRTLTLGASIGISLYPADAGDGDALLRNADAAMYRAKQLGRNQYRFYGR